jgi:hypothetical protein
VCDERTDKFLKFGLGKRADEATGGEFGGDHFLDDLGVLDGRIMVAIDSRGVDGNR